MQAITETIIEEFFSGTDYLRPSLIALFLLITLCLSIKPLKRYPKYIRICVYIASTAIIATVYNAFVWKLTWLYYVSGADFLVPVAIVFIVHWRISHKLSSVLIASDTQSLRYREDAALDILKSLSPKWMTPAQEREYFRYKLYTLIKLGNLRAVTRMMEEVNTDAKKSLDAAHYHFLLHILHGLSGDISASNDEIQKAEDTKNKDTDAIIQVEIALNHGVSYVAFQNYQAADDCFRRAAAEYKRLHLKNSSILYSIYYNYAFNKTRLDKNGIAWEAVVKEYEGLLSPKKFCDQVNLFNLKLDMYRQNGKTRDELDKLVQDSLQEFNSNAVPVENKVIFAGSVARIVWAGRLNPEPCFRFLNENLAVIDRIPPMARYRLFTDLYLLFADLHGDLVSRYTKLKDAAFAYPLSQAILDLETCRKALPEEAIYARCLCLKELAGAKKRRGDYNVKEVLSDLNNAVALYHENLLFVEEHLCRLDIMDELCSEKNIDRNYKSKDAAEMRKQRELVELFMPKLVNHPALAEFNLRLSFYCLHLDEYDRCVEYYVKFYDAHLSLENFSPWMHQYRMATAFCVRAICFMNAIVSSQGSIQTQRASQAARAWLAAYPRHDGILDSMLLAQFLGYNRDEFPLKLRIWVARDDSLVTKAHAWLYMHELGLNIDMTYTQFTQEKNRHEIFFDLNRHPFETGESWTVTQDAIAANLSLKGALFKVFRKNELSTEQKKLFDELYDIICAHVTEQCPPISETKALFADTMLPVPAINGSQRE